ncbi:unnamed protein product [Somion occarium]|uniref:DUF974-domain-containing protein n=1 Tax=Somion occarium TaxID=3059160 RepID=A0ABP1D851_9APHY
MSLQTTEALPGHPKTLRDFDLTEMLMLPAAFGAIQLGETFSSCLSVNNETGVEIEGVTLRVEMQSTTTKVILAEFGGPEYRLAPGDTMEHVVHHEIKELGQHVLACTVFYRLPAGARPHPTSSESHDPTIQSFRKFYKFAVTNPLSVKTKVHLPRSPSALLSATEREKVFLEVHIQNLTQDAMWLQRMHFECTDGWEVVDANSGAQPVDSLFSGPMALMQPQDMRQYIYILTPASIPPFPVTHPQGTVIPLGRLDISWRSSFGEPGRLLTSMLSRRIPLVQPVQPLAQVPTPPPKQPASAIPPHLHRSATVGSSPSRTQSPHITQRPMTPPASSGSPAPYRPGSPFRNRQSTVGPVVARPQSPAPSSPQPSPTPTMQRPSSDIEVDLLVRAIPRDELSVEKPFRIAFSLNVSVPVPLAPAGQPRKKRIVSFAVQHVQPPRLSAAALTRAAIAAPIHPESWSPRLPSSGFSTPSPYGTPYRGDFHDALARKLLVASPRPTQTDTDSEAGNDADGRESARETPLPGGARKAPDCCSS